MRTDGRRQTVAMSDGLARAERGAAAVSHSYRLPALLLVLLWTSCGGGHVVIPGDGGQQAIAGVVFKGPVRFGTVTAYELDDTFTRGAALATATTDAAGAFSIDLPPY